MVGPARWSPSLSTMTRIADLLSAGRTCSFEFFPPKTEEAARALEKTILEDYTVKQRCCGKGDANRVFRLKFRARQDRKRRTCKAKGKAESAVGDWRLNDCDLYAREAMEEFYADGTGWDNKIAKRFGVTAIPSMWLVNKKGLVVDMNVRGDLKEKVEKLLAEPAE